MTIEEAFLCSILDEIHDPLRWSDDGRTIVTHFLTFTMFHDFARREKLSTLFYITPEYEILISGEGHWKGPKHVAKLLVAVVLTEDDQLLTLPYDDFCDKHGWKNDPTKVRMMVE